MYAAKMQKDTNKSKKRKGAKKYGWHDQNKPCKKLEKKGEWSIIVEIMVGNSLPQIALGKIPKCNWKPGKPLKRWIKLSVHKK